MWAKRSFSRNTSSDAETTQRQWEVYNRARTVPANRYDWRGRGFVEQTHDQTRRDFNNLPPSPSTALIPGQTPPQNPLANAERQENTGS